ncbi:hypothetical protein C8F04DRAFT_1284900 [Mycena alexandri]|uniref:Uncharacterized protein n=1 Tax=Mycena alexandri TaxID=1745969 RepID=A0AAD6RVH8_9AGAR|nr:hypothetical protein C8F04DRAFT_1284900 [Mycena alexandri]
MVRVRSDVLPHVSLTGLNQSYYVQSKRPQSFPASPFASSRHSHRLLQVTFNLGFPLFAAPHFVDIAPAYYIVVPVSSLAPFSALSFQAPIVAQTSSAKETPAPKEKEASNAPPAPAARTPAGAGLPAPLLALMCDEDGPFLANKVFKTAPAQPLEPVDEATEKSAGVVLNALTFFDLVSTLAMRKLIGYGNRLLQIFCPTAFDALWAEKENFLEKVPDTLYPSTASVYSALTFELGGPHSCSIATGTPPRGPWWLDAGYHTWDIHCSPWRSDNPLGTQLGLLLSIIPSSASAHTKHAISIIQWAGSGIPRWFLNGHNSDETFAVGASEEQLQACEQRRQLAPRCGT